MKKIALFVLSLALMLGVCSVATAATITVGAYEYALTYLPIRTYYGYSYTQQIVSQSEINTSGSITKLRFYWYDGYNNNSNNWTIYMGHTTKTAFASTSDWIQSSAMTQVFSGTVTFPSSQGWMEITLNTAF